MKIINLGSLNIDKVYSVPHFVQEGETISSQKLENFCGGKGLNQSLALARAGAQVSHVGAVGQDGGELLAMLAQAGVDTTAVLTSPGPSGHAVIQVNPSGHNCIIVTAGANAQITPTMIDASILQSQPGDWFLAQNETSCVSYGFEQARAAGLKVAFNPSPIDQALLEYPLDLVDLFVLNEGEGAHLAGLAEDADPELILEKLQARYPEAAFALTLGSKGALCAAKGERLHQGIFPVKAVDTTAAGDTFCGFFLAAYTSGMPLEEALRLASAAAAIAVSRPGAGPSIPVLKEVYEFLKKQEG